MAATLRPNSSLEVQLADSHNGLEDSNKLNLVKTRLLYAKIYGRTWGRLVIRWCLGMFIEVRGEQAVRDLFRVTCRIRKFWYSVDCR